MEHSEKSTKRLVGKLSAFPVIFLCLLYIILFSIIFARVLPWVGRPIFIEEGVPYRYHVLAQLLMDAASTMVVVSATLIMFRRRYALPYLGFGLVAFLAIPIAEITLHDYEVIIRFQAEEERAWFLWYIFAGHFSLLGISLFFCAAVTHYFILYRSGASKKHFSFRDA